jgi:hypothetical protein
MSRGKRRRRCGQLEGEPRDHIAAVDKQEEWLSRLTFLKTDQRGDGLTIDGASEPVHGLGWIRKNAPLFHLMQGGLDRRFDFLCGPERITQDSALHAF